MVFHMFRNSNKNLLENLYFYFLFSILSAKTLSISQLKQERIFKREWITAQSWNEWLWMQKPKRVFQSGCLRLQASDKWPVFRNNGPGELLPTAAWTCSNSENQVTVWSQTPHFFFSYGHFTQAKQCRSIELLHACRNPPEHRSFFPSYGSKHRFT